MIWLLLKDSKHETSFQSINSRYFWWEDLIKLNLDFRSCLGKISNLRLTYSLQDEIELRRLRTENRLLRQRIDLLENESSELADKLIQVNLLLMVMVIMMMLVTIKMVKWSHVPYNWWKNEENRREDRSKLRLGANRYQLRPEGRRKGGEGVD